MPTSTALVSNRVFIREMSTHLTNLLRDWEALEPEDRIVVLDDCAADLSRLSNRLRERAADMETK